MVGHLAHRGALLHQVLQGLGFNRAIVVSQPAGARGRSACAGEAGGGPW